MRGRTDKGLVLRRVNVGESDRIVVVYTRHGGKISTIARGARQSKKRFSGSLEPFHLLRVEIQLRKQTDLALLVASEVETAFSIFLENLDAVNAGWRPLELLDAFEPDHHPNSVLFDELLSDLYRLQAGEISVMAWRLRFEALLLSEAGLAPRLDRCLHCDQELDDTQVLFSEVQGGVLCPSCRGSSPGRLLGEGELDALRSLFGGGLVEDSRLELRMEELLRFHLGRALRTSPDFDGLP